jgi:hypothetical protein
MKGDPDMNASLSTLQLLANDQINELRPATTAPATRRRRAVLTYDERVGLFVMLVGVGLIVMAVLTF